MADAHHCVSAFRRAYQALVPGCGVVYVLDHAPGRVSCRVEVHIIEKIFAGVALDQMVAVQTCVQCLPRLPFTIM